MRAMKIVTANPAVLDPMKDWSKADKQKRM